MRADPITLDGSRAALCVLSTSAWNGLASSPYRTWAFRRAELSAYYESPFHCLNGSRATMAFIRSLPVTATGVDRLEPIARRCVEQLAEPASRVGARLGVIVGMAERYAEPGPGRRYATARATLDAALRRALEARGFEVVLRVEPRGNGALAACVLRAADLFDADLIDAALVGGVDTAYDPDHVEELVRSHRLFDGEDLDTVIPGEGGAFMLLVPDRSGARGGLRPIARVIGAASGEERATLSNDLPNAGLGLSRVMRAATALLRAREQPLDVLYSDLSHEHFRSQEFQLAFPRISADMRASSRLEPISPLLGDLGAAAMPTGVALAIEGFLRGDPPGRSALVTGSSVGEERGAVCVEPVP